MIGVGNKTVSRWEKGYAMPDADLYENICRTLEISVNELLAGEKIPDEKFHQIAEQNLVTISKENEEMSCRASVKESVFIILEFAAMFLVLMFLNRITADTVIISYVDLPSIAAFVLLGIAGLLLEKEFSSFFKAFRSVVSEKYFNSFSDKEISDQMQALKSSLINNVLIGIVVTLMGLIPFFQTYSGDNTTLLPNIAVCLLPLLYAVIIDMIILPFAVRLNRKVYQW